MFRCEGVVEGGTGALEYADEAEITTLLDFDGESVPTGEQTVEPRVLTVQTEV